MVIVMKVGASEAEIGNVMRKLESQGFAVHRSTGVERTILGAVGAQVVDIRDYEVLEGVSEVHRITEPYKLASRHFRPEGSVIRIRDVDIGGPEVIVMAGPCTIENFEQSDRIAASVKRSGAKIIRGGAFKPRTSPYSFQGHGVAGLKALREAADKHGLLVVSELMEQCQIAPAEPYIDIIQVGARNMQNFGLLRDLGQLRKPVLLKRGMAATISDLLLSAEYVMSEGNQQVILCERGIRTFETHTRNTLDISAIPVVHKLSHLPIIVDPSHAVGIRDKVPPVSRAAVAAGADGLIVEVHHDPDNAICDGAQSLFLEQFGELMNELRLIAGAIGRRMEPAASKTLS